MLCEEIKPRKENEMPANTDIQWLQPIRTEIEYLTEEFLKRGGKIAEVDPRASGEIVDNMSKYINEFTGGYDKHRADIIKGKNTGGKKSKKPRKESENLKRSKYGQNIFKKDNCDEYYVCLSEVYYGRKQNMTQKEAIELRDKLREKQGMPPAEY